MTRPEPAADDPPPPDRPRGPRRAHVAATVREARHLVETTLLTYSEIGQRTGLSRGTIWNWARDGKWMRPAFAPRWTHTVPAWRAGRQRKRRMLAVRLVALAERTVRALEAAGAIEAASLREARALLAMAKRAIQTPHQRLLAAVRPLAEAKPRGPGNAVAQKGGARHGAAQDRAVDRMTEDVRQTGDPRQPHPAAIRREDVSLSQRN